MNRICYTQQLIVKFTTAHQRMPVSLRMNRVFRDQLIEELLALSPMEAKAKATLFRDSLHFMGLPVNEDPWIHSVECDAV